MLFSWDNLNAIEYRLDFVFDLEVVWQLCGIRRLWWRHFLTEMIYLASILPEAEADVTAGSQACAADVTDRLTLFDRYTGFDAGAKFGHVEILRFVGFVMFEFDKIAIAGGIGNLGHTAIGNGTNGCATRSGIVGTEVAFVSLQDRVEAVV